MAPDYDPTTILAWLAGPGRRLAEGAELFGGICERVRAAGLPLERSAIQLFDLHPLVFAYCLHWHPGAPAYEVDHGHTFAAPTPETRTPYHAALDEGGFLHRRLERGETDLALLRDLRAQGFTDYLSIAIPSSASLPPGVSWATRAPGGFADGQVALLKALAPHLGPPFEMLAERRKLATVLRTYVGRGPATEVLAGRVRRGDVRRLDAVVLLTDLRGFSRMTAIHSETETLTALALYAEAVVAAVTARGGDVLKLMGDGILAIFPVESPGQAALACTAALAAVRAARADLALTSLEFVAVLNLGAVAYGNVGARERLDFTVIGDAVNVASRIEAHAKRLAVSVAMTAAVARHLDEPVHLLGQVELKDLPGSWELFGVGEPPYR